MNASNPYLILGIVALYFIVLLLVARRTSKSAGNKEFFTAGKQAPWYLVAFGMIGASLSGVTFISIPGLVGAGYLNPEKAGATNVAFSYMQMVFGYVVGYVIIALVLLPLYYRLQLTSIYTYLQQRFGRYSYKTGAGFFLLSRIIGASFRLFLVAMVFDAFIFQALGIPFWLTTLMTIGLIWVYTFQGGIKTIVWTDSLQTACMLLAVVISIVEISGALGLSAGTVWPAVKDAGMGQVFFWDGGWSDSNNFLKQFLGGASIAVVMTGLDQDMMQKNLACKNLGEAQKNVFSFSLVLVVVNFVFLLLGALLALYAAEFNVLEGYAQKQGIGVESITGDKLYPIIAFEHLSLAGAIVFILGLVAAAYSSADSALTALTTSFCVDFLEMEASEGAEEEKKRTRYKVHLAFSFILFLVILLFWQINDSSVINKLFKFAGYTYGPLLGLYSFGLFNRRPLRDRLVPVVCIAAPLLTYVIQANSEAWFGYKFGFELLLLNGLLTFLGLYALSLGQNKLEEQ